MGRILIADDHDALRRGLVRGLTDAGHEVEEASNGNAAIERLHDSYFDVVLSDLKMGGSDGLDVLRTTRALHPTTAVILMTAFGSVNTAVEAMKSGAFDYVQKPFEIEEMEVKIEKALEVKRLKNELDYLRGTQQDIYEFDRIVGSSAALAEGARHRQEGGEEQHDRAHSRRNGHRQGAHRRRDAPQLAADDAQLREGQLRGAAGEPARVRAVRPREGRLHRRGQAAHRPLRAGRRRHAVPRRNRRHEPEHAGEDSARPAGARIRAAGRHAHAASRRPAHRGDQPRPAGDGAVRPFPRGPVLPVERRLDRNAAASRTEGRHRSAGHRRSSASSRAS